MHRPSCVCSIRYVKTHRPQIQNCGAGSLVLAAQTTAGKNVTRLSVFRGPSCSGSLFRKWQPMNAAPHNPYSEAWRGSVKPQSFRVRFHDRECTSQTWADRRNFDRSALQLVHHRSPDYAFSCSALPHSCSGHPRSSSSTSIARWSICNHYPALVPSGTCASGTASTGVSAIRIADVEEHALGDHPRHFPRRRFTTNRVCLPSIPRGLARPRFIPARTVRLWSPKLTSSDQLLGIGNIRHS